MKRFLSLFFVSLCFCIVSPAQDNKDVLQHLDEAIANKNTVRTHLYERIDSIRATIPTCRADAQEGRQQLLGKYREICDIYVNLQADSALHYLQLMDSVTGSAKTNTFTTYVDIRRATMMGVKGLYPQAIGILDSISHLPTTPTLHAEYLHAYRTVYGWAANYMQKNHSEEYERYERFTEMFRDSILIKSDPSIRRSIAMADKLVVEGQPDEAIDILLGLLPEAQGIQKAYAYFNLAESYRVKGDTDRQIYYLALTALEDLNRGATEYVSLPTLALLLYERGDITRAYNYLFSSMEDAQTGHAFLRAIEINEIFPLIAKAYHDQQNHTRNTERSIILVLVIAILLVICGLIYINKQRKKLEVIRCQLADVNDRLENANTQLADSNDRLETANSQLEEMNNSLSLDNRVLAEANKVREQHIAHYLGQCRNYIDITENFRKEMLKLAKNNQREELLRRLKSDELISEEQHRFYADFDRSFLKIHPDFIQRFNALLGPESHILPKKDELLSPELRIFALIRLGVNDTAQLAHFLNYSMPTIYNYRSRIINSSIYPKEEFLARLMEI